MCRKLIYLISFVLVLSLAGNASAELVAHWRFDEGSGNVAYDTSGNGHDGTINGAPNWVPGVGGSALEFDGADDYVGTGESLLDNMSEFTLAFWVSAGNPDAGRIGLVGQNDAVEFGFQGSDIHIWTPGGGEVRTPWTLPNLTWHHVAVVGDGTSLTVYVDGEVVVTGGSATGSYGSSTFPVNIGGGGIWDDSGNWFSGMIDDVRIYDHALSEVEVQVAMNSAGEVWPYAVGPVPADGALLTEIWVSLGWSPGGSAVSHDVYLGDNFDDVNDGTGETFRGNQGLTPATLFIGFIGYPYPDGLVPGTTYYWRIDEVNDTDPNSPWKGDVWSFTVPSRIAYEPDPADGVKFVDPNVELNWTGGLKAELHYVYFGDNFDDVNSAVEGLLLADTTYTPGPLELDKTYYWRVDEFDLSTTHKGDVWSFKTLPDIPITDPNLVGWWKLDEGMGTTAVDWSGYNHHGTFVGDPQWVVGYDGGALEFDGDDHVDTGYTEDLANYTITCWVISPEAPSGAAPSGPLHREQNYQFNWNHGDVTFRGAAAMNAGGAWQAASYMPLSANTWYHLAATYDGNVFNAYRDGVLITSNPAPSGPANAESGSLKLGRHATAANNYFTGTVDDARVYNKALTLDEIQQTMRGDPLLAGAPNPTNGSTPYIREATPLSWLPGENASQHDVYFGTDRVAVADANASDTTSVYRGRQVGTSYTPLEGVEWGGGPYYWRVDEYNTDATISEGRIWSFTVADYLLVEDFELYNDLDIDDPESNRIYNTWIDGWGVDTNGSEVGYATPDFPAGEHFVETNIVHGGSQSMPYFYDTNFKYSEATYSPTRRDWTEEGVGVLSLWFRGNPVGFVEDPVGTYTMSGAGTDIWDLADEFRYAWKQLSGDGSIVAQVLSVENTNVWAKAGVMIRETLDPGSKHAFVCITPGSGKSFQNRKQTDLGSSNSNTTGFAAPYWVKLVRQGNLFTAYHSEDGVNWVLQAANAETANPETVSMGTSVYIGLALTSHNSGVTCVAEFSDVETTGAVTPLTWTHEAIGATMAASDPAPMYVALNGGTAVYHGDLNAPLIDTWTEWTIDLQEFTGVNLTNVNTLAIGFGDKNNLQPGGSGLVFFDDVRLYRPEPEPEPQP